MTSTLPFRTSRITSLEVAAGYACLPLVLSGDPKLSDHARALIEEPGNERNVSVASLWEIAIKISIGKLEVNGTFAEVFPPQIESNAIRVLPIEPEHLDIVSRLPFHHRDPFDRLILAQSIAEDLPILSRTPSLTATLSNESGCSVEARSILRCEGKAVQ